jgi:dsRNA-specific ribonuclease
VACAPDHRGELEEPEVRIREHEVGGRLYADSRLQTTQQLFDAYVGAVYSEKGYSSTKAWIQPLVDPNFISNPNGSSTGASTESSPPTISLKDSSLSGAFLAAFNQTAMKHRVEIQWNGVQSGPAHSPTWKIECISELRSMTGWLSGDAKIFSCSWWSSERHRDRKKQARG